MRVEQVAMVVEEGDEKKKKNTKRRSNRRSKQNSPLLGIGSGSGSEIRGESSSQSCENGGRTRSSVAFASCALPEQPEIEMQALNEHGPITASDVAFSSMPTMGVNEQVQLSPKEIIGMTFRKSCPEPIPPFCQFVGGTQRSIFAPHWSMEYVNQVVGKGNAFKALFCANAHNRFEAYCRIEGVPVDVLICGIAAQNRAVEGDVVVIQVEPLPCWTKMKWSNGPSNNLSTAKDCSLLPEAKEMTPVNFKGKSKVVAEEQFADSGNSLPHKVSQYGHSSVSDTVFKELNGSVDYGVDNGCFPSNSDSANFGSSSEQNQIMDSVERLCALINSSPSKRPTGRVVAIVERSPRRDAIVGFLNVKQQFCYKDGCKRDALKNKASFTSEHKYIQLTPTDPRFPKMMVLVKNLPDCIILRLENGDVTVEMELVAAQIDNWSEESPSPQAHVSHVFGRGSEMKAQINAILYENAICCSDFSSECLSCLPHSAWEVPFEELKRRRDLRKLCIFTIDPSTATDLDDALSFERLPNGIIRVGVHIADVSYFVLPDTAIDIEAQTRSTTVYMLTHKIPMLPLPFSEDIGSLNPGVDRLTFSIFWELNSDGDVLDRWIGHTVIRSCCKLSYDHVQDIIDGKLDGCMSVNGLTQLHGHFKWSNVFDCVRGLHEISKRLRERRFDDGALRLEGSKIAFLFDEYGIPCDSVLSVRKDSDFLVEEFMLLANSTAAEVISRAFPDCALLWRHPKPNMQKLREFEAFCSKHGLELDTSSGQFHHSLEHIREKLKDDGVLFDILISYASRPMQLAMYFCSGDLKDNREDWGHYALAVPHYTHFTSPLRRYPDILVHRTLAAAVDAEELYIKRIRVSCKVRQGEKLTKCFTGLHFDKDAAESIEGREVLSAAALKHCVPGAELLSDVAAYCNERKLASRHVKDACDKLYMWVILRRKEVLLSEARVLGLGPRFMSVYIHQLAIERRIYYDEVEGMTVEWLETTSTLVLNFSKHKHRFRKVGPGYHQAVGDVALVINPCDLKVEPGEIGENSYDCSTKHSENTPLPRQHLDTILKSEVDASFFPLTVRLLSTIPVALHAVGGDDGPLDIGVRLFVSTYFG